MSRSNMIVLATVVALVGLVLVAYAFTQRGALSSSGTASEVPPGTVETASPIGEDNVVAPKTLPDAESLPSNPVAKKPADPSTASNSTKIAPNTFVVKKVMPGFTMQIQSKEKTLELAATVGTRTDDPANLELCLQYIDTSGKVLSESSCEPLRQYGTWSMSVSFDNGLAPLDSRRDYWDQTDGKHFINIRIDLVDITKRDTPDPDRPNHIPYKVLASDDIGVFELLTDQKASN